MKKGIYCIGVWFSLSPERALFHHEKPPSEVERPPRGPGLPIDVETKGPAAEVLRSGELFKSNYTKHRSSYAENPDTMAPWRFLSFAHQQEYRACTNDQQREAYLHDPKKYPKKVGTDPETGEPIFIYQTHWEEIQSSHAASVDFWNNRLAASLRVPRVRPSLIDRPELMVDKPAYVLGGWLSQGIAENFRGAKVNYVPGGDPMAMLQSLEQTVQRDGADNFKGASAIVTFDPELFSSEMAHDQYVNGTRQLLVRLKELGMAVTVFSPLKVWNEGPGNVPEQGGSFVAPGESRNATMARRRRNDFWEAVAKFKMEGLVTCLVDLADATQSRDTRGTNPALLTSENGRQVLNAQGVEMAVNGAIMGINVSQGYESGNQGNEEYAPGGSLYEYGKTSITGKPIQPIYAGAPLVDKSLRDAALEKITQEGAFDKLRRIERLDTSLMGNELLTQSFDDLYSTYKNERFIPGMHVYSHPARKAVDEAFLSLKEAEAAGQDVTEMASEFSRLASSIYVKLARIAIIHARELFEDPDPQYLMYRKDAYEHARKKVEDAEAANAFYHFFDSNVAGARREFEDFKKDFSLS